MKILCVGVVLVTKSQLLDVLSVRYQESDYKCVVTVKQMEQELEKGHPDLLILDAVITSKELHSLIRSLVDSGVTVVVLSTSQTEQTAISYLKAGAIDVLMRPIVAKQVHQMLDKYFNDGKPMSRLLTKEHHRSTKDVISSAKKLQDGLDKNFLSSL